MNKVHNLLLQPMPKVPVLAVSGGTVTVPPPHSHMHTTQAILLALVAELLVENICATMALVGFDQFSQCLQASWACCHDKHGGMRVSYEQIYAHGQAEGIFRRG